MGHFVVGDDATGIGIGKATLDHDAERQLPDQLFTRAVVGLLLQQADEVLFGCGHEQTLAPAAAKFQSSREPAHCANVVRMHENQSTSCLSGVCRISMKPKSPSPATPGIQLDAQAIDELYGLEPVFEPAAESSPGLTPFAMVQCPYCGESSETAVDWSAGAFRYIEDCHVCCQPIELAGHVDDDGTPLGVTASRS